LFCSYKEESDDITESDDLIEMDEAAIEAEETKNDSETIEKVLLTRIGRAGATGHKTTLYNVTDNGDPNEGFDKNFDTPEVQYFIKWKNWSHIHNTWESEASLKEQTANGMKKLDNYRRKEEEVNEW
jgi:tagatose-1,6-bisphosphate aldolase